MVLLQAYFGAAFIGKAKVALSLGDYLLRLGLQKHSGKIPILRAGGFFAYMWRSRDDMEVWFRWKSKSNQYWEKPGESEIKLLHTRIDFW